MAGRRDPARLAFKAQNAVQAARRRNDTRRGLGGGPSRWPDTRSRGDRMFKSIKNRTLVCAWIAVAFLWSAGVHADDHAGRSRWVGTWATGPAGPAGPAPPFSGQTARVLNPAHHRGRTGGGPGSHPLRAH